jgi:hypothetical protein
MTCEPVGSYISKRYIFHIGHRPARVSAHIYHRYYFLSGASAYTGCAEILYSVWGIGLHRMCRCIIFCLGYRPIQEVHIYHFLFGYRPARVLHGRPIQDVQRYHLLSGVSACKGSAWPAYTGCAEISSSVWGVGLQGFCMAGLYTSCIGRPVSCTPGFAGQCTCPINRLCSTIRLKGVLSFNIQYLRQLPVCTSSPVGIPIK